MYFKNFPVIAYEYEIDGVKTIRAVRDITLNVRVRKEILDNIVLYDEYDLMDGETPEMVSNKIYGSPIYHWIIMLFNDKYDYVNDFPLVDQELNEMTAAKYGAAVNDVKYIVDEEGYVVGNSLGIDYVGQTYEITNYEYEVQLNESKRRVKIVSPSLLPSIINQLKAFV